MNRGSGLRIGKILGIPIYLHSTWVFIFAAITYMIAAQFKQQHPHWTETQHWTVGVLTSLLFFASVLFHELSHSAVAQHYNIRVVSITLFLFGGLARIEREPSRAIQEFNIAIAGPLASGFLSGGFFGLTLLFPYSQTVGALATWLCGTNAALAVFNLLPGFPLDGGRIFRAIVWGATKSFEKATRVAGASGKMIAYAMILFGAWGVVHGNVQMLWTVLIGWFILNAAQESVAQMAIRETLAGLSAADVMSKEVPTVPGHITLEEYGTEVLRTGRRCHLVVSDDRLVGMMNPRGVGPQLRPSGHDSPAKDSMDIAGRAAPGFARAAPERGCQSDACGERRPRRCAPNRWNRHPRLHSPGHADAFRTRSGCHQQVAGSRRIHVFSFVVICSSEKESIRDH
ncbi:MAG: hypothetical protein DMG56_15500 [Acidobacteria bacterium]|nr:MAG: hypothetical protein DMG56_15500 [Acidobacteriota bacterium]